MEIIQRWLADHPDAPAELRAEALNACGAKEQIDVLLKITRTRCPTTNHALKV
jgi:hypothetical protein